MRRTTLVLLVLSIIAGGAPALLGQRLTKGKPGGSPTISVRAKFQTSSEAQDYGGKLYSSSGTTYIDGVIAGDEFVLGPDGALTFDFTSPVPGYDSKTFKGPINYGPVGISTQQDTQNTNLPKKPLQELAKDETQCVQLGYSWFPEGKEYRLIFHRWKENDPSLTNHRTSYALVTCNADDGDGEDGSLCTNWTVEAAIDCCSPGSPDAIGALWDFTVWRKAYLLGVYHMPHKFTVERIQIQ